MENKLKVKLSDKIGGIIMLILLCGFFIGGLAGVVNSILYSTIGMDDTILECDISKVNEDKFILGQKKKFNGVE